MLWGLFFDDFTSGETVADTSSAPSGLPAHSFGQNSLVQHRSKGTASIEITANIRVLLVPQGLDRVQFCSLRGRVDAESDTGEA